MSKLTGVKTAVSALASTGANQCENCGTEVDEELKEVTMKSGRKRIQKKYCESCYLDYMGRSSQITITMHNSLIIWLDQFVKEKKAQGIGYTQSNAIRKGLELLRELEESSE